MTEGAETLPKSLSVLVKHGLTLALLWVLAGLMGLLPGAEILLFGRVPVIILLRCAAAVAASVILLVVYRHSVFALCQTLLTMLQPYSAEPVQPVLVTKVSSNSVRLVYVCLFYWLFARAGSPLVAILTNAAWPFTTVEIASLIVAVVSIVGLIAGASPLFGVLAACLTTTRHAPADEAPSMPKCSECGVLNDTGSRFCKFCGRSMATQDEPVVNPPSRPCAACGTAVRLPARFCPACGTFVPSGDGAKP